MRSHHCRHCGDPRTYFRPSLRRWKLERLYAEVRAIVLALSEGDRITAEDVATRLRAKKPMVEQCFHRLNLAGLLSQGINSPPHDSTRDRSWPFGGPDSSWMATMYERL